MSVRMTLKCLILGGCGDAICDPGLGCREVCAEVIGRFTDIEFKEQGRYPRREIH